MIQQSDRQTDRKGMTTAKRTDQHYTQLHSLLEETCPHSHIGHIHHSTKTYHRECYPLRNVTDA